MRLKISHCQSRDPMTPKIGDFVFASNGDVLFTIGAIEHPSTFGTWYVVTTDGVRSVDEDVDDVEVATGEREGRVFERIRTLYAV